MAEAAWMIGLLFFAPVGLIVFLVIRGHGMEERSAQAERDATASVEHYIRRVSGGTAIEVATAKTFA